ncbi:MAG: AbrB/MazE/SpoVT family DNA-binding domain-containing protein [Betaproteobacteria bacterium]|nr:AbrB/MazE/SpoVT family DNA-binding domain-containing protein [Betaproteobacteria bacterium]
METTRMSSKGQVILPKTVRMAHRWEPGVEFTIEDRGDGVLLRPVKPQHTTRLEDVIGCIAYQGPARTVEEMDEAIAAAIQSEK